MSNTTEKLTRLKHLVDLGTRTKSELDEVNAKVQELVTVGGEPNVIEKIKLNGVEQTVTDKAVDLTVEVPEYSIAKATNSGDYAAVYNLTKDGVNIGASINIPKDMVVESGSVVENPAGQPAGTYIELRLQNVTDPIYINVGSLIEYVTSGSAAGDMVVVAVSDDHKVTATITDGSIPAAKLHADVQSALNKAHEHGNASVLEGITAGKVTAWDSAEGNAKAYADGLAKNYDAAGSASQALTDAKAYVDGMIATDAEVTAELNAIFGA